ncbi:ArfGap-domain-containing protein [Russula earlei]|uniref:ArfGap-domain-containing protein n=1 Tax=Russula earlei TaxID=71964 RepID=A0ACC0UNM4_9AGAM|nr:ArfGap-domain-containing protein [Russula earlei]
MDQTLARRSLQELIKREDLKNKFCVDCGNPNPQWASLSFAVFICLQCAGIHRGFGVHISFVRSVSMDTWQEDQVRRMKIGGNGPFVEFMRSYTPIEHGGYSEGMSIHEKYHSWAAAQYREKLDADLQGKPWTPSLPPQDFKSPNSVVGTSGSRPPSAQGLRKSRASSRTGAGTALRADSASPSLSSSASPVILKSNDSKPQKTANESYFATLGSLNASRPEDLPPSLGGRYQGFGNTPDPPTEHPSYGLSSRAAPTLSDLQENPMAALSKGWSLFSSAMVGASRAVSENVIQPGMERVKDPTFHASVRGYVGEAGRRAGQVGSSVNQWGKSQLGVDVAEQLGGVVDSVRDQIGGGPHRRGYDTVFSGGSREEETSALYRDHEDDEDLFSEYHGNHHPDATSDRVGSSKALAEPPKSSDGWDDEWKDF